MSLRDEQPYLYEDLLPENVFGHTKKVRLFRETIERVRRESGRVGLRILDIGCGSGYAVTRFLGRQGDEILGIDVYPANIAYATEHFGQGGLRFECADVNALTLDGRSFDIVVMADVLEHLQDPSAMLVAADSLLAPEGRLLVTVPNGWGAFELESALSRLPIVGPALLKLTDFSVAILNKTVLRGVWTRAAVQVPEGLPYNVDSGHVQFFSMSRMVGMVARAGMTVVMQRNLSFLAGPFTNSVFTPWQAFCVWNTRVADRIAYWLASAWLFECQRAGGGKRTRD